MIFITLNSVPLASEVKRIEGKIRRRARTLGIVAKKRRGLWYFSDANNGLNEHGLNDSDALVLLEEI